MKVQPWAWRYRIPGLGASWPHSWIGDPDRRGIRLTSLPLSQQSAHWVVIPAYNEAATIRDIAIRALRQAKNVIVVDDGSHDGTAEALAGLPLTLLRNPCNCGKAASLWRGFQHALEGGAAGIIALDADGQHAPEDSVRLLGAAQRAPEHLIIGARRRDQRRKSLARYCANRCADFWISWAAGYTIEDTQSGFRIYPAALLQRIDIKHGKTRSFVFESEVLIESAGLGYQAIPVTVGVAPRSGARPSHFRPLLDIARITCMVAWKLISRGLYPSGLYRSLAGRGMRHSRLPEGEAT